MDKIFLPFFIMIVIVINQQTCITDYSLCSLNSGVMMKEKSTISVTKILLPKHWAAGSQPITWCSLSFWRPGDCGPPPDLPFASPVNKLIKTDFKTGTALKYTCHPGFSRIGSSKITCNARGSWDYSVFCTSKYQHLFFSPVLLFYLGKFS